MSEHSSAEAVFCEALEKEPAERAAFLDRVCGGNEPLRARSRASSTPTNRPGCSWNAPWRKWKAWPTWPRRRRPTPATTSPSWRPPPSRGLLGRLDHYEVLEVVGKGGTGIVLRARDSKLMRVVAVKVLGRRWPPPGRPANASPARPGPPPPSATSTSSPSTPSATTRRCPTW